MKIRTLVVSLSLACLSLGAATPALAQALPAFPLTAPDGTITSSAALDATGQWLLAYVVPGSAPSDRLVQSLGEEWSADRAARVIFVVAGAPEAAKQYLAGKGGEKLAADARWFADPQGEAWSAMKFQGTLAITGMLGTKIDWKIDGVIADPDVLQPAVAKWLGSDLNM
jgi:hypothetical protein